MVRKHLTMRDGRCTVLWFDPVLNVRETDEMLFITTTRGEYCTFKSPDRMFKIINVMDT